MGSKIIFLCVAALVLVSCLLVFGPGTSCAELRYSAGLSDGLRYESNIFLRADDESSDTVNDLSLNLGIEDASDTRSLHGSYTASAVNFFRYSSGNYVGHALALDLDQQAYQHLVFSLHEGFYLSEEPLEPDPEITATRTSRQKYYRNTVDAGLSYIFGEEDRLSVSYMDGRLWNEAEDVEDNNEYGPSVELEYWPARRHGFTLSCSWRRIDYEITPSNLTSTLGAGYRFRPSTHTTWTADYSLELFRDLGPGADDYNVHNWSLGLERDLGPHTHAAAALGYYLRDPSEGSRDTGLSYSLSIGREFARGSLEVTGAGGQRGEYLDAENRGFTEYRSIGVSGSYDLTARTGLYASASYLHELSQRPEDTRNEFWTASAGATYQVLPWLTCSMEFSQRERTSSEPDTEYRDTMALVRLSATREWR